MHVEIQVAQNFVLNFLYNKLPRRRVNLFGEELDVALRDKFADHWYPDKPFKGSAYRCLKITDPADPVLNRAAKESGNPVSDIIENLPTDLAIWIDPGEVSYRIGEKGSVKILYSENDSNNYAAQNGLLSAVSPGRAEKVVSTPAHPPQVASPTGLNQDDLNQEIIGLSLPLDNLNSSMNSLSLNGSSTTGLMNNPASNLNGFAPFTPRPHQPVTYTAGTFAQTKFGSTKLKTNGKKPNRMSPTEFSNYIKQRAMQKQNSCPNQAVSVGNPGGIPIGGGQFRNSGYRNSSGGSSNGFYNQQQNLNLGNGGINCGRGQQQQQQQQGSPDPFFYPLFPDRNGGMSNGLSPSSSSSSCSMLFGGLGGNGSLSSSGSSSASSISSNPWSYPDTDSETFIQEIFNVGLKESNRSGDHFGQVNGGLNLGPGFGGISGFGSSGFGGFGSGLYDPLSPTEENSFVGASTKAVGGPISAASEGQTQQQTQSQRVLVAN